MALSAEIGICAGVGSAQAGLGHCRFLRKSGFAARSVGTCIRIGDRTFSATPNHPGDSGRLHAADHESKRSDSGIEQEECPSRGPCDPFVGALIDHP